MLARRSHSLFVIALGLAACAQPSRAAGPPVLQQPAGADMRARIDRYQADRGALVRTYRVESSAERAQRLRRLTEDWSQELAQVDFGALDQDGKIDWILLQRTLRREDEALDLEARRQEEMKALLPFVETIAALAEGRRKLDFPDPEQAAAQLDALAKQIDALKKVVEAKPDTWSKSVGKRAHEATQALKGELGEWYRFGKGYDPVFEWWVKTPWEAADKALESYAGVLKEKVAGLKEGDKTIVGDPIGRDALVKALNSAWIAYTPEELVQIAEKEFSWCEAEMKKAARDMGLGEDWKKALEQVKQVHVPPGQQPELIRDLAREAVDFIEQHELVTVPELAKETWRMDMMSPERQLVSPFFTGGEVISVSYPTDAMTHEQKEMSMRGNNRFFSRATVHHELIPGHHLQQFMTSRYMAHRRLFSTPFWTEGWALYWEMVLWDQGFPKTPEDRVGMLFWRMHRCARIRFSLGFHLGTLTPEQCIDMLVNEVGHERDNAEAEVRRSFDGSYEPLYQCAYMLGALEFRAMYRELVASGKLSARAYHDAVLHSGNMPIELVRARLENVPLTKDFATSWRFYELR